LISVCCDDFSRKRRRRPVMLISKFCFVHVSVNTGRRTSGLKWWDKKDIVHAIRSVDLDWQFISVFESGRFFYAYVLKK
jgi:hypothetical protein